MQTSQPINTAAHQQDTDLEIIVNLTPYIEHQSFIDVGAEKGVFAEAFASLGLSGTLFEPLPKHKDTLETLVSRINSTFHPYAIDANDGNANFHIACDENDEPLDYFHSLQPLSNDSRIKHNKIIPVICRSLNSLYKEGVINKNIGILKTDTEGNDLRVMQGMHEINAEVLVCEYFMPGIYAGWEEGHPEGLLKEAKKLGFNHFVIIKRIDRFEFVAIDNPSFIDKQWGNFVFMKDAIFIKAKDRLEHIIKEKEVGLITSIVEQMSILENEITLLRKVCDERNELIKRLDNLCKEKDNLINVLNKKKWFKS